MYDASNSMNSMNATNAASIDFISWLAQNIENVRNGAASYQGERVTVESEASRYFTCFSLLFFTTRSMTPYFLNGTDSQKKTAVTAFVCTFFAGWWGIPFGVIFTPIYLFKNATGGDKITVANLIDHIEHPEKLKKGIDGFAYGPAKVLMGAFAVIAGLMILLQGYIWITKGTSPGVSGTAPAAVSAIKHHMHRASAARSTDPTALFMEEVQHNLKRAWYPPKGKESSRVKVIFTIDETGVATNPRIVEASSNPIENTAAMAAIKNAEYPPLPSVLKPSVDIEFTFDYNVDEQGNKKPLVPAVDYSN